MGSEKLKATVMIEILFSCTSMKAVYTNTDYNTE